MMRTEHPLVSVALCTYNGQTYLREQLDSLVKQTYRNIEIIIVDDCSTDDTVKILNQYAAENNKIKLYQNDINLGFNRNFEKAIKLSNGHFIAISDQDDIWELHKIEVLLNQIDDNWLIFSNSIYINEKGTHLNRTLLNNFDLKNKDFKSLLFYNFVTGHTVLFQKAFLHYILPLPEIDYYDWYMGFIAIYHHKLTYCDLPLTRYRIHHKSFIQNKNTVANLNEIHAAETKNHLNEVSSYKNLSSMDEKFIKKAKSSFEQSKLSLLRLIITNYKSFFPDLKERKGLSLFNFAWKYATRKSL